MVTTAKRWAARAASCALAAAVLPGTASAVSAGVGSLPGADAEPVPAVTGLANARLASPSPLPTSQCVAEAAVRCYSPLQYQAAYNLHPLYAEGITGKGRTIVVVDSYGSPTLRHDLHVFDQQWHLPDPVLDIDKSGDIPVFDPSDSAMTGWAYETSLDVEYAHAIAPGARIAVAETPVAETEGVTGFPQMMKAEQTLIDDGTGDVISQSFGATENTFPGFASGSYSSLLSLRYAFEDAARHHVTVLAGTGDSGATDYESDTTTLYPYPVSAWPATDPLVTAVGGTQLTLDDAGSRLAPDTVWNDGYGAGGGGVSAVFTRPRFQNDVAAVTGGHRGVPDISMTAAVNGGCWVYESFDPAGAGWQLVGGTSEATPVFAGIVALADQKAGHRLGDINTALYRLGQLSRHDPAGISDITAGDNTFAGVTGYTAGPRYDLASGWGTINAARFVPALAASR